MGKTQTLLQTLQVLRDYAATTEYLDDSVGLLDNAIEFSSGNVSSIAQRSIIDGTAGTVQPRYRDHARGLAHAVYDYIEKESLEFIKPDSREPYQMSVSENLLEKARSMFGAELKTYFRQHHGICEGYLLDVIEKALWLDCESYLEKNDVNT